MLKWILSIWAAWYLLPAISVGLSILMCYFFTLLRTVIVPLDDDQVQVWKVAVKLNRGFVVSRHYSAGSSKNFYWFSVRDENSGTIIDRVLCESDEYFERASQVGSLIYYESFLWVTWNRSFYYRTLFTEGSPLR